MSPAVTAMLSVAVISGSLIATAEVLSPRRAQAEADPSMDDLLERPGDYAGRHRDQRPKRWQPAHTADAVGARRAQHTRPAGVRPDRRIEQTQPLSMDRLQRIVAGGAR